MILFDTHALIWTTQDREKLGAYSVAAILAAQEGHAAYVSAITPWEISMLTDKDRLELGRPVRDWIQIVLSRPGVRFADLSPAITIDAGTLPGDIHGDPADRILIATARALGCALITADRRILRYAETGHVQVLDARR